MCYRHIIAMATVLLMAPVALADCPFHQKQKKEKEVTIVRDEGGGETVVIEERTASAPRRLRKRAGRVMPP